MPKEIKAPKAKASTIAPRGSYLLIEPVGEASRQTDLGLIIPSSVEQEQKAQGRVMAVGSAVTDIVAGQMVVYGAYAGETIKLREGGQEVEYRLVHEEDVIAYVHER